MMDSEVLAINEVDLEDGELSDTSEEVYVPLERPKNSLLTHKNTSSASILMTDSIAAKNAMDADEVNDEEDCTPTSYSSSDELSDSCLKKDASKKKKKRIKRTVMVRIQPTASEHDDGQEQQKRAIRFKKYDIWTAALQEEALTENMRGCDVTHGNISDRNVENYDFSLRYRLNGENSLKRRLSTNSTDELSDTEQHQHQSKRHRPSSRSEKRPSSKRSVHERLGGKRRVSGNRRYPSATSNSDSNNSYEPRLLADMDDIAGRESADIAREMANKLQEEKDDLLVRVLEVLGTELPLKIYTETQRIEADGGMTIKNGKRRRTPGGVFLFLLKNHESLNTEDQKAIFNTDRQITLKKHKDMKTIKRDRKVEALKKRLSEQVAELPTLSTRKELMLLGDETEQKPGNLSNPPPSPEASEQTPDYKSLPINHEIITENIGSPSISSRIININELNSFEDDFLDVHCDGDMDLF